MAISVPDTQPQPTPAPPPTVPPAGQPPTIRLGSIAPPSLQPQPSPLPPTVPVNGQPQTFSGAPLPPLSTPAAIPVRPVVQPPNIQQIKAQAQPASSLLIGPESSWTNMVNDVPTSSGYATGYFQITDGTWRDFAPRAGIDLNQYPRAVDAPFNVQQQVANTIPLGRWETKDHVKQQMPWATDDMTLGQINRAAGIPQQYVPAAKMGPEIAERPPTQWGRAPEGGYGQLPTPGQRPSLLQGLMPIIGLLSGRSGIAAAGMMNMYSGYVQGYQQGQVHATKLAQEQFSLQVAQHNEQMQEENQAIGEAMAIDPTGTKGPLQDVANRYGDNVLTQAIQMGQPTIEKLMQARDRYNTDLTKLQLSLEKEREQIQQQRDFDNAVNADVTAWTDDFQKQNGRPPNSNEMARARESAIAARNRELNKTGRADTPQGEEAQIQLDAARAATEDWAKQQPTPPTENQIKEHLAQELQKQKAKTSAGGGLEVSKLYDIVNDKNETVETGVELREQKGTAGFVHAETSPGKWTAGDPIQLKPGERLKQTTPTTTSGGRAGAQTLRQVIGGREVLSDLQMVQSLPIGTTTGPFGNYEPGKTIFGSLYGDMVRYLTPDDAKMMQVAMAGLKRELSTLMSPVYGGNYASEQLDPLIPKDGDDVKISILKLARLGQSADNALEGLATASWLSQDERKLVAQMRDEIKKAIPWTPKDAIDFGFSGIDRGISFGEFVKQGGLQTAAPSSGWGTATPVQ